MEFRGPAGLARQPMPRLPLAADIAAGSVPKIPPSVCRTLARTFAASITARRVDQALNTSRGALSISNCPQALVFSMPWPSPFCPCANSARSSARRCVRHRPMSP